IDLRTLPPVTRSTPAIMPEMASAGPERTMMPSSREATACLREGAFQGLLNMLDLPFVGADAQFSAHLLEDGVFLAAEFHNGGDLAQWHPPLMQAHDDVFRFCRHSGLFLFCARLPFSLRNAKRRGDPLCY